MANSLGLGRADADAVGRVAGTLFLIGSVMTVMGILLPDSSKVDVGRFWGIAAGTAIVGALLSVDVISGQAPADPPETEPDQEEG